MEKCKCCDNEAEWAWQPFGPGESPDTFSLLGSHYRGFSVIKICDTCKQNAQAGIPLEFIHKSKRYIGNAYDEVLEVPPYVDDALYFWERGGLPF